MAQKRSEFYKSLNQMRDSNQNLGNPLINQIDDSTNVGSELSSFAYSPISETSALNVERNGWQKFNDTIADVGANIGEGFLNFVDGIFDGAAYVIGMFGNDEFKQDVKDTMNYDWQQHVLGAAHQLNVGHAILTGDITNAEYWENWADTLGFGKETARENLNKLAENSFQDDWGGFGDFLKSSEQAIGYVLPSITLGIITGGASTGAQIAAGAASLTATGISAFGSGTNQALNEGADYGKAGLSGLVTSGIEMGTEALSMGVGKAIGKITGKLTNYGTRIGAASFGQELGKLSAKEIGKAALEEGTEEFISEILSPLSKQVYDDTAIEKSWLDVGSKENVELIKNALTSFGAGAIGGAFGGTAQGIHLKSKITNKGIDLANNYNELVELHQEAINEAKKGSKANLERISQLETRLGEATKSFELEMEAFKKENPHKFDNLMKMLKNPQEFIGEIKKDTYTKLARLNSIKGQEITIGQESDFDLNNFTDEFLKENGLVEGDVVKAYYDNASKTTLINPKYKHEFYQILGHEKISHGILDTNEEVRENLIKEIESDKKLSILYHKFDKELKTLYKSEQLESERLARFLENFIQDQKTYDRVFDIADNKLLKILNKIKTKLISDTDSKLLSKVENAIKEIRETNEIKRGYQPRLQFSKLKNTEKTRGVYVDADIIKQAAQFTQDNYIDIERVDDVMKWLINSTKSLYGIKKISLAESRDLMARKGALDFNTLLNKPSDLKVKVNEIVDTFLKSQVEFNSGFFKIYNRKDTNTVFTLKEGLEIIGTSIDSFKKNTTKTIIDLMQEKSKPTKKKLMNDFYKNLIKEKNAAIKEWREKATNVPRYESSVDLIRNSAQAFQERFVYLKDVNDLFDTLVDVSKWLFNASNIEIVANKDVLMKKTYLAFNDLLNKPGELRSAITDVFESFMDSKINSKTTIRDIIGEDTTFKKSFIDEMINILTEKSKPTRLVKLRAFYQGKIVWLSNLLATRNQMTKQIFDSKRRFEKIKKFIEENNARVNKTGDLYVPQLEYFKNLANIPFNYTKSGKTLTSPTIKGIVNALSGYNETNINKLNGVWTTKDNVLLGEISDEEIRQALDNIAQRFTGDVIKSKNIDLELLTNVSTVLNGVYQKMHEIASAEGIARRKATNKADLELQILNHRDNVKTKIGFAERELNYTSSMGSVFANYFGENSATQDIMYNNIFKSLDKKYLQEATMRNELQQILEENDLWSSTYKTVKKSFGKTIDFCGQKMTRNILLDIYALTMTDRGLETLQNGGYAYKLDKENTVRQIVLTPEDVTKLEELITEEEKNVVYKIVKELYNGSWKAYKKQADRKIRNFTDVLENEVYYPTNKVAEKVKIEDQNFKNLDMSDQSFNKRRKVNTSHMALKGMGLIERAMSYIDGLTKYGELTQDLKVLNSLLSQRTTDKEGKSVSRNLLYSKNIPNWSMYSNYLVGQILGTNNGIPQSSTFNNLVSATLFGNVGVVLKQTASIPTILLEVSPKAWSKALVKGWGKFNNYKNTKAGIEALSGIAAQRWKDFDAVAANTLSKEVNKLGKLFGIPMEKMDEGVIVLFGWTAAQEQAKIETGADIGTEQNNTKAIEILNRIIARTQSNYIPINTSMARSGNAKYARKVLSYFSSDLQNIINVLNELLNGAKYAKQRVQGAKNMVSKIESEIEQLQQIDNPDTAIKIQIQDKLDKINRIQEIQFREEKYINGGDRDKKAAKLALVLFLKATMIAGIEWLIDRLYGRKGWTEDSLAEFGKDLLIESTLNNLPYMSHIVNAVEYNQDIGGYDLSIINSAIDIVKDIKTMVDNEKFDWRVFIDLATTLGQLTGIPTKNLYNLIMGVWKNADESGYKAEALVKGYKDSYIRRQYSESLANGQTKQANAHLTTLLTVYKVGNYDDKVNEELIRLSKQGYNVLPRNTLLEYDNDKGELVTLTNDQRNSFVAYYGQSTKEVKELIKSKEFLLLDDENKAKVIKKVFDTYYDVGKSKIVGNKPVTKIANVLKSGVKLNKYVPVVNRLGAIQATKKETRKELILREINKLQGYNKTEKLLILWLCGYSLSKENKVALGNYLIRNGGSKKDIKELLK